MKEMIQINNIPNYSNDELLKLNPGELMEYFIALNDEAIESKLDEFLENEENIAFLSYWEKYLSKERQVLVDKIIDKKTEIYGKNSELPLGLENKFSDEEVKKIISNLKAIQLTYGCSKGCVFCGFDAVPRVRESIEYSQLVNLFKGYGHELSNSKPFLYWASEPNDYASKLGLEDKTYEDVDQLVQQYAKYSPHVTTKDYSVEWLEYLKNKQDNNSRVSTYGVDKNDIGKIKETVGNNIELIGGDQKQYPEIGKNFYLLSDEEKEEAFNKSRGIGCVNGFILTPRGLYNVCKLVGPTDKFPQGQIVVPFKEFNDVEIKIGENIDNILPFYKIDMAANAFNLSFDFRVDRPLVIEKKSGEKLIIFINGVGEIVSIKSFLLPDNELNTREYIDKIKKTIVNKNVCKVSDALVFFSHYKDDEIRDLLKMKLGAFSKNKTFKIRNKYVSYKEGWKITEELLFDDNGANDLFIDSDRPNIEKINIAILVTFNLVTGSLEKVFINSREVVSK